MTEPTTEAGKALLYECISIQDGIDSEWGRYPGDPAPLDYEWMILEVERAAADAERRRIHAILLRCLSGFAFVDPVKADELLAFLREEEL